MNTKYKNRISTEMILAIIGSISGLIALYFSWQANSVAKEANLIARENNIIASKEINSDVQLVENWKSSIVQPMACINKSNNNYYIYFFASTQITLHNFGGRAMPLLKIDLLQTGEASKQWNIVIYELGKQINLPIDIDIENTRTFMLAAWSSSDGVSSEQEARELDKLLISKFSTLIWNLSFAKDQNIILETHPWGVTSGFNVDPDCFSLVEFQKRGNWTNWSKEN